MSECSVWCYHITCVCEYMSDSVVCGMCSVVCMVYSMCDE